MSFQWRRQQQDLIVRGHPEQALAYSKVSVKRNNWTINLKVRLELRDHPISSPRTSLFC